VWKKDDHIHNGKDGPDYNILDRKGKSFMISNFPRMENGGGAIHDLRNAGIRSN
jgi:hypothetical protein